MPHTLKNKNLEILIDLPLENYRLSRFDWTGKIVGLKFQNIQLAGIERTDVQNRNLLGRGFYNEFGIDTALGFEEAAIGGWFHKIGVGLCKKDDSQYRFMKSYEIQPAAFQTIAEENGIVITCKSESVNGYAYLLKKKIELLENAFTITYSLENTGETDIRTDEYVHNFLAVNHDSIGSNYVLNFPFQLKPKLFKETVNPELKVLIGDKTIKFKDSPEKEFFFSNLTGGESVTGGWNLLHLTNKIGIRETASFESNKVNLWGWRHVISPELFFKIFLKPGETVKWSRNFTVYRIE